MDPEQIDKIIKEHVEQFQKDLESDTPFSTATNEESALTMEDIQEAVELAFPVLYYHVSHPEAFGLEQADRLWTSDSPSAAMCAWQSLRYVLRMCC